MSASSLWCHCQFNISWYITCKTNVKKSSWTICVYIALWALLKSIGACSSLWAWQKTFQFLSVMVTVEPLYKGHWIKDTSIIRTLSSVPPHRAVYKYTSELGTPLCTGQPAGRGSYNGVLYREVQLYYANIVIAGWPVIWVASFKSSTSKGSLICVCHNGHSIIRHIN